MLEVLSLQSDESPHSTLFQHTGLPELHQPINWIIVFFNQMTHVNFFEEFIQRVRREITASFSKLLLFLHINEF